MKSVLTLAVALVVASVAVAGESFQAALAEAKSNAKTAAGAKYDDSFGISFGRRVPDIMVDCTKNASDADLATFDLVAKVASDGSLEDVMVGPETKVARCLRDRMPRSGYPTPPRPHYWVFENMKIK